MTLVTQTEWHPPSHPFHPASITMRLEGDTFPIPLSIGQEIDFTLSDKKFCYGHLDWEKGEWITCGQPDPHLHCQIRRGFPCHQDHKCSLPTEDNFPACGQLATYEKFCKRPNSIYLAQIGNLPLIKVGISQTRRFTQRNYENGAFLAVELIELPTRMHAARLEKEIAKQFKHLGVRERVDFRKSSKLLRKIQNAIQEPTDDKRDNFLQAVEEICRYLTKTHKLAPTNWLTNDFAYPGIKWQSIGDETEFLRNGNVAGRIEWACGKLIGLTSLNEGKHFIWQFNDSVGRHLEGLF